MSVSSTLVLASEKSRGHFLRSAMQILGASLFIALCAQIQIPLFITPVPLTGQTFAIMLIAATMGSRIGLMSVIAYIAEGAMGLPVFTGARFGLAAMMGPSGGYIVGFMFQAYLVGLLVERQQVFSSLKTIGVLLSSCVLQLGLGALWMSHYVGLENALLMGVAPYVIGEVIKSLAVTSYLKTAKS